MEWGTVGINSRWSRFPGVSVNVWVLITDCVTNQLDSHTHLTTPTNLPKWTSSIAGHRWAVKWWGQWWGRIGIVGTSPGVGHWGHPLVHLWSISNLIRWNTGIYWHTNRKWGIFCGLSWSNNFLEMCQWMEVLASWAGTRAFHVIHAHYNGSIALIIYNMITWKSKKKTIG